jgi:ABC-type uncharacterized transport system permease subunit
VVATLAYALPALAAHRLGAQTAQRLLWLAWASHALSLLGLLVGGLHFGFGPALSVTAWLMLTVYIVESQLYPQLRARWAMGMLGALAVLLALIFPGAGMHMARSAWLPLHLALGLSAYGLFAAAVVHAWMMTRTEQLIRTGRDTDTGLPLLTLERLTFNFVYAGFVLLTATLLAGMVFGEQLYGHAWRWDHKTVFALMAWLTFVVLIVGRHRLGWRGKKAVRVLYTGTALLLLSYAGSRFVLEVLLGRMS